MKPHIRIEELTKTMVSRLTLQWFKVGNESTVWSWDQRELGVGGCGWRAQEPHAQGGDAARDRTCSLEVAGWEGGFVTFYSGPLSL